MPAELRPTPQQPVLGTIADILRKREELQRAFPTMTGTMLDFILPTSETVEKWSYGESPIRISPYAGRTASYIPSIPDKPYALETAATLPLIGPATRAVSKTANRLGDLAVQAITRNPAATSTRVIEEAAAMSPLSSIVKPKGGNWLTGELSPENALRALHSHQNPEEALAMAERRFAEPDLAPETRASLERSQPRWQREAALNKWVDTKLSKYVRNEMATQEDPVRALAERGVLHFDPRGIRFVSPIMESVREKRILAGMPVEEVATSPLAQQWERYADNAIDAFPSQIRLAELKLRGGRSAEKAIAENPWLEKVPVDTPTYSPNWVSFVQSEEQLGFPHLLDELRAAMDPASELPQHLRIDPKDIDKITVPQAVERVAKINAWRAEEAARAEKAGMMANLEGGARLKDDSLQLSFVEKPGGTWIDLPEATEGKNLNFCTTIGKQGGWCTMNEGNAVSYGSGDNRLVVLVDAEGRPHLQAQISKPENVNHRTFWDSLTSAEKERLTPIIEEQAAKFIPSIENIPAYNQYGPEVVKNLALEMSVKELPEFKQWMQTAKPPDITQLKPPENTFGGQRSQQYMERDPDYKAKMTDAALNFLNSRQWGRVNDLDLFNIVDAQNPDHVVRELRGIYGKDIQPGMDAFNAAVDADPYAPRFMKRSEFLKFIEPFEPLNPPGGMAGGGLVSLVRKYSSVVAKEAAKEAPKEQKMLQGLYRGYAGENKPATTVFGTETNFTSPQRRVSEYYAEKRAAQTGEEPHVEMLLVDPSTLRHNPYGLSIPVDEFNKDFLTTRARRVDPDEVVERTQLKAEGGLVRGYEDGGAVEAGVVQFDPELIDRMAAELLSDEVAAATDKQPAAATHRPKAPIRPEELQLREGAASVRPVRGARGDYVARLGADVAPGVQPFVDIDPWRKLIAQYGVQYAHPLPGGGASAELVFDPVRNAQVFSGAYKQQLGKDSELSARGSYMRGEAGPSYNVGLQYRKTFATGGLVQFDSDKIDQLAKALREEMYA